MNERSLLAGIAVAVLVAAVVGAAAAFGDSSGGDPVSVRATEATGNETDVRCDLPVDTVENYPALDAVVADARNQSPGTWATRGISVETGEEIVGALEWHCETVGGLYVIDGEPFLISLPIRDDDVARDHHDGHEH